MSDPSSRNSPGGSSEATSSDTTATAAASSPTSETGSTSASISETFSFSSGPSSSIPGSTFTIATTGPSSTMAPSDSDSDPGIFSTSGSGSATTQTGLADITTLASTISSTNTGTEPFTQSDTTPSTDVASGTAMSTTPTPTSTAAPTDETGLAMSSADPSVITRSTSRTSKNSSKSSHSSSSRAQPTSDTSSSSMTTASVDTSNSSIASQTLSSPSASISSSAIVSNPDNSSNSGFLSNKPAVIGTFTAVGIVIVAILALLLFLCLKRRGGRPTPVRSERSLGSRGIDHDEGLMGYRDSEPNTPSVPGFNHHSDTGALAAGGAGAAESASRDVRFTDATAENRSVDYGLLDDGRYSSEKDGEFGYTGGDGRQATSYSYPSVSSSPSLGSTGLPPRGLSDAYYLGARGTGGASGSDYTIDPNSSSNSFFPAQSMTSHTSNATTPPATATSADQWANRALAKSNASALGKEVFSPFQSFQQFENLQQQEPISPRQSSYYRDSQFGDYFSSGGNGDDGAYSGIAIGYASQLSPAASPIPLPLPVQGEKDVDVNINEESDWRKFDGPKPGSPSALGREVFQGFGDRGNDGSSNSAYLFSQNRF